MRSRLFTNLFLLFIGFCTLVVEIEAQTIPDFSSIDISTMSNQQLELLLKQASAMGYSEQDLLTLAKSQGISSSDLSLLNGKIKAVQTLRVSQSKGSPVADGRLRKVYSDSLELLADKDKTDIYGLDIFRKGSFLSFQTNQNVPTPDNYTLGSGDELFIDVYGASENYYQAKVSPDGTIILENIGPISLSGLTVDQASSRIKNRLGLLYDGIKGESPNTFMNLSLGQTRSVNVNVVGQVEIPGTYNLSALNTVFNALYAAGGVTELGTLREIKHFRNNQLISTIDIYEYLENGFTEGDNRLESGDVILVQPYTNRVTLSGATKISGRFEMKDGQSLSDLLNYAGGFSENANTESIKLNRVQNGERFVADVNEDQYQIFSIRPGDTYVVSQVLNRYSNRVVVQGAVYRPGNYSITQGLTIQELLDKTDGLRPDAFLMRALIKRTKSDLSTETISFNLQNVLNGTESIDLQKEDVITIFSKNELKEESFIELLGEVNKPGILDYSAGTNLNDAILMAGGFSSSAAGGNIEVSRRIISNNEDGFSLSETFVYNVDINGKIDLGAEFTLQPYDQIVVRRNPNYRRQQVVTIEGQVKSPGQYAIKNQGERISDLLNRAGGVNQFAFIEGATLIRKTEFFEEPTDIEQQIDDLEKLQLKFDKSPELLTESEIALLSRIERDIKDLEKRNESNQNLSNYAKRERIKEVIERNALTSNIQLKQAEAIGIDLQSIINNSGSVSDLLLEEGDVLIIPKRSETVRLRGKLLYPTTSRFVEGKSLRYYINSAGGFDYRAKKKGTYVVYANGEVARTRSFLFLKFYPKSAPGAEIIVPTKPLNIPVRIQDVIGITSGLATLALVINQINLNNN